jgi:hypothetical protein
MTINTGGLSKSIRSQYFANQFEQNRIIRDLDVGLAALRGGGADIMSSGTADTAYLPRFENEPDEFYFIRIRRTYLTNYFKRAIVSDSGKILANNVMVSIDKKTNDDIPSPFREWVANMNLDGDNLTMMIQNQLKSGMAKGISLIMTDYDSEAKRPYTREIDIDSVLSFKSNPKTGRLKQIKFLFNVVSDSEEDFQLVPSIFEVNPTTWKIYDNDTDDVIDEGEIIRYRNNGKDRITDEIPVDVFYTNKTGQMLAQSPYQGLAELTIEHYQVYSDIKNMMFYALTPILTAINAPTDFEITMLASYMFVKMPATGDVSPELKWTQVDTGALEQGQKQLEGIERRISTYSIDSNSLRPGTITATQASMEGAGTNAALKSFAVALSEHVQNILTTMVSYTFENVKEIKGYIAPEFNSLETDKEMRVLLEMRRNGDLSPESIVDAAIQRKLLPPDFDKTKNTEGIMKELDEMIELGEAKAKFESRMNKSQQASDGLMSKDGKEEISGKPRDA